LKLSHLEYLCCLKCRRQLKWDVFDSDDNELNEGLMRCPNCGQWYPVMEGIGYFLDDCYASAKEIRQAFLERYELKLEDFTPHEDRAIEDKNRQILFFGDEASTYTEVHTLSTFVRLLDADLLKFWGLFFMEGDLVVDIGCGTGMRTLPLAEYHGENEFIATDICLGMLRIALKDARAKRLGNISFAVADAERLPVASGVCGIIVGAGILHHVPDPQSVLRESVRVLKPNGRYLGIENNKTVFRFIFDLFQKIVPVWKEEAGNYPLIAIHELRQWGENTDINFNAYSHVFVPPQLINRLPMKISHLLWGISAFIGRSLPFIRTNGGMLFIEGEKLISKGLIGIEDGNKQGGNVYDIDKS